MNHLECDEHERVHLPRGALDVVDSLIDRGHLLWDTFEFFEVVPVPSFDEGKRFDMVR